MGNVPAPSMLVLVTGVVPGVHGGGAAHHSETRDVLLSSRSAWPASARFWMKVL